MTNNIGRFCTKAFIVLIIQERFSSITLNTVHGSTTDPGGCTLRGDRAYDAADVATRNDERGYGEVRARTVLSRGSDRFRGGTKFGRTATSTRIAARRWGARVQLNPRGRRSVRRLRCTRASVHSRRRLVTHSTRLRCAPSRCGNFCRSQKQCASADI